MLVLLVKVKIVNDDLVRFSSSGQAKIFFLKMSLWSVPPGLRPCWPRSVLTRGQSCSILRLPVYWCWCEWTLVTPPHPPVGLLAFQLAPLKRVWQQAEVTATPLQYCGPSAGVVEHNDISSSGGRAVAELNVNNTENANYPSPSNRFPVSHEWFRGINLTSFKKT